MDKTAEKMDDLITRYVILLRFTTSQKKITDLLTDFMFRVTELKFEAKLKEELIKFTTDQFDKDYAEIVVDQYLKQRNNGHTG